MSFLPYFGGIITMNSLTMSLEAKSFQLALNYATWSYNGYNGCTDCRVLAVYTGYTVCHVLRPQNKMSSPREVLWTYARGVHPFELEREEILISEEFRKRQETVKWRGFDTFRVGKKKWKMRNVPRPPHRRFQIPAQFGGFQNIWVPPLWFILRS